jgi:hypothetical protein
MDLDLTKEQKILKRSAQDFLKKECPPSLIREMKDNERMRGGIPGNSGSRWWNWDGPV